MVQLTIRIRPQRGYTYANSIRQSVVDSSDRLETIVEQMNTSGSLRLFLRGTELPLNSSLATHNVRSGDILETCSCPVLSAVLSAVICDLEVVQKLPEDQRTLSTLQPLLDHVHLPPDDWEIERWSFENTKRRGICLKFIKKVLQRNDRFASLNVPACETLEELQDFLNDTVWSSPSTMTRGFQPRNRQGQPTLCWTLVQQKLNRILTLAAAAQDEDSIEAFVQAENDRHAAIVASNTTTKDTIAQAPSTSRSRPAPRKQRRLPPSLSSSTPNSAATTCTTCRDARATCLCLDETCPFFQQPSCRGCFAENHPVPLRSHHERVELDDVRARAVLRQNQHETRRDAYCPEFASGGFAVLCALLEASLHTTRPQLSLTEHQLKARAQPRCRSNLYDRQARGRSAFACVDGLAEKGLIRKEVIPGQGEEQAKYSLLTKGETLAKACLKFEQSIQSITVNENMIQDRSAALGAFDNRTNAVSMIVDTREDKTLASRLKEKCRTLHVDCEERELPAGDYIFTTRVGSSERVLPLVIERKTWSDLADSVTGRGQRRLNCVRIGSSSSCDGRQCQLCKMKRSQCKRIMFVIEGARCLGRDGQDGKCSASKRCKYCKELQEQHGPSMIHAELEKVLYRIQAHHGCLVHFTRGYNETITSLLLLREILGSMVGQTTPHDDMARAIALSLGSPQKNTVTSLSMELTYNEFCSNARSRSGDISFAPPSRGRIVEWTAESFVRNIHTGQSGLKLSEAFESRRLSRVDTNIEHVDEDRKMPAREDTDIIHLDDDDGDDNHNMNESQSSIEILEPDGWASAKPKAPSKLSKDIINIDSDSDQSVEAVEVIESAPSPSRPTTARRVSRKRKADKGIPDHQSKKMRDNKAGAEETLNNVDLRLFVIKGLYEYDTDFHSDANKIWKQLYSANSNEQSDLSAAAKQQLQQLQETELPFIERDSILFWILYLQVKYGIVFHAPRRTSCLDELRSYWTGSVGIETRAFGGAVNPSTRSTPVSTPKPPPTASYVPVRPTTGSLRRPDRTVPTSARAPRPPVSSRSTEEARLARLRRFEGLTPHGSTSSDIGGVGSVQWECSTCTYLNDNGSSRCAMCGAPGGPSQGSASRSSVTGLARSSGGWNCEVCTFQNQDTNASSCGACGSHNPFRIGEETSASHTTPGVARKRPPPSVVGTVLGTGNGAGTSTRSKIKCAACGQRGHNRGTATAQNCPAYHDEAEVQLRNKKKEAAERKAREARDQIEELTREEQKAKRQWEEAQRAMAELRRTTENRTSLTENELRRLEKDRARAEKRARKFT